MTQTQLILCGTCLVAAAIVSAITTVIVRRLALRRGIVDRPGGHKAHSSPVALLGGVTLVTAVLLPMLVTLAAAHLLAQFQPEWLPESIRIHLSGVMSKTPLGLALVAGGMALHVMGLVDDLRPLGPLPKLVVQVFVAAILVIGFDVRLLTSLGVGMSSILSILWIVTLTNAFNFLDNMDGLASGVAIIATSVFATASMQAGQWFVPAACWLLVGALLGFLPFNMHPATIFLGDAGSLVIGYLVGVLTILVTFYDPTLARQPAGVLTPLVVMAVPLYDTLSVFYLRWRDGYSIWHADRRHFSHRLQRRGLSVREAVGVIWLATAVTAFPAMLLANATPLMATGLVCQTAAVVVLVAYLEKAGGDSA